MYIDLSTLYIHLYIYIYIYINEGGKDLGTRFQAICPNLSGKNSIGSQECVHNLWIS